ncbi:unnamed protein product [Protopolystoma xenopodis]|uniref:Secreted protein n=1 Tax=Protopolystoma xenopodis TaxID=117903 RepID=A0A448X0C8_9PLAT|nr:unnamed protein product [Protopolystoma xenopodis]
MLDWLFSPLANDVHLFLGLVFVFVQASGRDWTPPLGTSPHRTPRLHESTTNEPFEQARLLRGPVKCGARLRGRHLDEAASAHDAARAGWRLAENRLEAPAARSRTGFRGRSSSSVMMSTS